MKRLIACLCLLTLFAWVVPQAGAKTNPKQIELDLGKALGKHNGHETAPITSIANAIGAKVDYNAKTGVVTLTFKNTVIEMQVGSKVALVNGVKKTMPVPVTGNPGTAFVPIRFVAEALGLEVTVNKGGKVKIKLDGGKEQPTKPVSSAFLSLGSAALRYTPRPSTPYVYIGVAKNTLSSLQGIDQNTRVLVVSRGMVNTGGHGIEVKETRVANGRLEIAVELVNPPTGSMNTQAVNYPYEVIYLKDKDTYFSSWVLKVNDTVLATGAIGQNISVVDAPTGLDLSWARLQESGISSQIVNVNGQDRLVVVVTRGQTNNAGYAITVDSIVENSAGVLEVNARHIDPLSGVSYAQVITYPYKAVMLDPLFFGRNIMLKTQPLETTLGFTNVNTAIKPAALDYTVPKITYGLGKDLLTSPGTWNNEYLLVVTRGVCPSTGYDLTIESVKLVGGVLRVYAKKVDPAAGTTVNPALTFPYRVVKVNADVSKVSVYELYLDGVLAKTIRKK